MPEMMIGAGMLMLLAWTAAGVWSWPPYKKKVSPQRVRVMIGGQMVDVVQLIAQHGR